MNSPITSADVIAAFPTLAGTATSVWDFAIPFAYAQLNADAWGSMRDYGALLLAAHLAKSVSSAAGASGQGPVTGETVGSVSRQYAAPGQFVQALGALGTTGYGQEYARLLKNTVSRWVVG
jgi:hypothetical protein